MARSLEPPSPWDSDVCSQAIIKDDAEMLAWLLEHGAPHPDLEQLDKAFNDFNQYPDPAIFLILKRHKMALPQDWAKDCQASAQRSTRSWCTLLGLVRWARRTKPLVRIASGCFVMKSGALEPTRGLQTGLPLLMRPAELPDELMYHIGAAAGMHYKQGFRMLRRIDPYADQADNDLHKDF
ncbi:hypothetical protein WJX74_003758 [Apatococcus lobatus]|uniref:Uncharacterized protein n=1 Tax=Apatococcus lobatus TaxID=904363 RepID=A0AAW1QV87_9CHLO